MTLEMLKPIAAQIGENQDALSAVLEVIQTNPIMAQDLATLLMGKRYDDPLELIAGLKTGFVEQDVMEIVRLGIQTELIDA